MGNFIVSARKYRPATFDSVVGQLAITNTLKNALSSNKIAQAFLFCGPRGVGKTTCARILAKTINCNQTTIKQEACDKCESCVSFNEGKSLNILELDAASNNSVDDIRHLIDQVRFAPQIGDYKVYIIDEVHMLSQAAFNAFLKTLEEPPTHAIFILATTEKHKIIPTILSRCQIFDFRRIQINDIVSHLEEIAQSEKVAFDKEALHLIAQKADGALRDALSMFDQLVSFTQANLTYELVVQNLNILDYDYYFKQADFILEQQIPGSLLLFNEVLDKGFNGHNFIVGLAEHFRSLLLCKDSATIELLEVSEKVKAQYAEQCNKFDQSTLLTGLSLCSSCDVQYKMSKNQRLLVEFTLMKLCSILNTEKKNFSSFLEDVIINLPILKGNTGLPKKSIGGDTAVSSASSVSIGTISPAKETPASADIDSKVVTGKLNKKIFKTTSLSIKSDGAQKKKSNTDEEIDLLSMPHEKFDLERLLSAWKAYAELMKADGKESLYSTLMKHNIALKDSNIIELVIENKVQESDLEVEKPNLLAYIREQLSNYSISIKTKLVKVENENRIYTSRDRFKRMVEKNPCLQSLKDEFDLDIEF